MTVEVYGKWNSSVSEIVEMGRVLDINVPNLCEILRRCAMNFEF